MHVVGFPTPGLTDQSQLQFIVAMWTIAITIPCIHPYLLCSILAIQRCLKLASELYKIGVDVATNHNTEHYCMINSPNRNCVNIAILTNGPLKSSLLMISKDARILSVL